MGCEWRPHSCGIPLALLCQYRSGTSRASNRSMPPASQGGNVKTDLWPDPNMEKSGMAPILAQPLCELESAIPRAHCRNHLEQRWKDSPIQP